MSGSSVENNINGSNKPLKREKRLAWRKHLASCIFPPVKPWGDYRAGIQDQLKSQVCEVVYLYFNFCQCLEKLCYRIFCSQ